ncbi:MAG: heme a synthase [Methylobacteriaceae bacterium]|jgi:cytochrome c oxidase assembly protein subunit 15|nr:heme a synthase [Methylobacteriaceae bacterium]
MDAHVRRFYVCKPTSRNLLPVTDRLTLPTVLSDPHSAVRDDARAVRVWLWTVAVLVFLMVIVGGAVRLTESGLSITEWKPITGIVPPLSHAAWLAEFEKYKQIPQYRELFPEMDLTWFQAIYTWEWGHRLLGRLIGFAFALPLIFFWVTGRVPAALKPKLLGVLALGALQGAVGWWMVASGLSGRVEVAQERLAIHLLLASLTLAAIVWIATGLARESEPTARAPGRVRAIAACLLAFVFVQIGFGGLVAGLRAGLTYNTWPLMDGRFVPLLDHLTQLSPWWTNLVDNITTVQFAHRMTAYCVLALAMLQVLAVKRALGRGGAYRRTHIVFGLVFLQVIAGITTLLLVVPISIALLHQALAMLVLIAATVHLRRLSADSHAARFMPSSAS